MVAEHVCEERSATRLERQILVRSAEHIHVEPTPAVLVGLESPPGIDGVQDDKRELGVIELLDEARGRVAFARPPLPNDQKSLT